MTGDLRADIKALAQKAWIEYRNLNYLRGFPTASQMRRREFIAGFLAAQPAEESIDRLTEAARRIGTTTGWSFDQAMQIIKTLAAFPTEEGVTVTAEQRNAAVNAIETLAQDAQSDEADWNTPQIVDTVLAALGVTVTGEEADRG